LGGLTLGRLKAGLQTHMGPPKAPKGGIPSPYSHARVGISKTRSKSLF